MNFEQEIKGILAYVFFSADSVDNRYAILKRFTEEFSDDSDIKALSRVLELYEKTSQLMTYDYCVSELQLVRTLARESSLTAPEAIDKLERTLTLKKKIDASKTIMTLLTNLEDKTEDQIKDGVLVAVDGLGAKSQIVESVLGKDIYQKRKLRPAGALTFIKAIDAKVGGLEYGTVTVVAGYVGNYKTTFLVNLLYNNVVQLGYNSGFITLEVPKDLVYFQILARHTYNERFATIHPPVNKDTIIKGTMNKEEEKFVFEVVEPDLLTNEKYGRFTILEMGDFDDFKRSTIRKRVESISKDIDLICVDYMQLFQYVDAPDFRGNDNSKINHFIRVFAGLALSCNKKRTIVTLASQTNREGYARACEHEGAYDLLALAEANELERSATYVTTLFTDDALRESGELKVQLLKHRWGEIMLSPATTYVDPRYCVVGDSIEGFADLATGSQDLSSLVSFGEGWENK